MKCILLVRRELRRRIINTRPLRLGRLLVLPAFVSAATAFAQSVGDFRSAASGNWNSPATWERYDGAAWVAGFFPTNATAGVVTIQSGNVVSNSAAVTADQIIVTTGGTLQVGANLTIANGLGVDLDISGTVVALGGSSAITLQSGSEVIVRAGGLLAHNGTSTTCINNSGATLTFESGGKFILQRSGATVPAATWNSGSTCEVNYVTASTSRPGGLGQAFANFHWNNTNQPSGNDLANTLTNVTGKLTINAGLVADLRECKLYNSSGSGAAFYGGDLTINAGKLNWASAGGPFTWTLRGNLTINAGAAMDISGTASGSYTLLLDSGGVQNYTCQGANTAAKLNWSIAAGTTLNLNDDLSLTASGRTLTANGTVNLNGKTLSTDLVVGTGTIRNAGGGAGLLAVGAGNGSSTLDGSLALLDGASGSLGLAKRGTGTLSILAAQIFSGGLAISGGTVFVNNTSGSGTGTGDVSVTGGKLAGDGTISGPVSIYDPAAISPGTAVGKLTINNTLTLSGNTLIDVDKAAGTNDQIVATTVNYGGTLTATSLSGALSAGDSFVIFRAGAHTGDFASIAGTPGDGLEWRFDPATGVLSVVSVVVNPPTLLYTVAGAALTFTWAEAGFRLQAQTNSLSTGIGTNWADIPGGETSGVIVPIDVANPCVFFRLTQ